MSENEKLRMLLIGSPPKVKGNAWAQQGQLLKVIDATVACKLLVIPSDEEHRVSARIHL